mmetsp:Transcript_56181/g.180327  ORF Transcript_56181/g.180327 Transcript_56181/m.180327 type:complete len:300 (-) Transcript_56181:1355-2254(-)
MPAWRARAPRRLLGQTCAAPRRRAPRRRRCFGSAAVGARQARPGPPGVPCAHRGSTQGPAGHARRPGGLVGPGDRAQAVRGAPPEAQLPPPGRSTAGRLRPVPLRLPGPAMVAGRPRGGGARGLHAGPAGPQRRQGASAGLSWEPPPARRGGRPGAHAARCLGPVGRPRGSAALRCGVACLGASLAPRRRAAAAPGARRAAGALRARRVAGGLQFCRGLSRLRLRGRALLPPSSSGARRGGRSRAARRGAALRLAGTPPLPAQVAALAGAARLLEPACSSLGRQCFPRLARPARVAVAG